MRDQLERIRVGQFVPWTDRLTELGLLVIVTGRVVRRWMHGGWVGQFVPWADRLMERSLRPFVIGSRSPADAWRLGWTVCAVDRSSNGTVA